MRMFTLRRGLFGANHLTGIPEPIDMMSKQKRIILRLFYFCSIKKSIYLCKLNTKREVSIMV